VMISTAVASPMMSPSFRPALRRSPGTAYAAPRPQPQDQYVSHIGDDGATP